MTVCWLGSWFCDAASRLAMSVCRAAWFARIVPRTWRLVLITESPMSMVAPCAAICCCPSYARRPVSGNHAGSARNDRLLIGGSRSRSRIGGIEPSHRIAVGVGDLLHQHQIAPWREKARVEHLRRVHHLAVKVVLLLYGVVGLQGSRSDLDGVGKDLCSVLDLLSFVLKGLTSFSICTMAWPDCVGSKTMPEPNCAFAAVAPTNSGWLVTS
jgi:hypothetical protein